MPGTKIIGDQRLEALPVGLPVRQFFPSLSHLVHCKSDGLANKRGARIEMIVEAAVRQTRELHQVDNTEPIGALQAQTVGGVFNDPIVGLTPVVFYVSHRHSVQGDRLYKPSPSPPSNWNRASLMVTATFHCNAGYLI